MKRPKHPDKDIEAAIQLAEKMGWVYKASGKSSHAWGRLLCPLSSIDGCSLSIWSTPRVAKHHAKAIISKVCQCGH